MGQYYKPTNLDKMEWVYSHEIKSEFYNLDGKLVECGEGMKLMEHSYLGNKMMNVIENFLLEGGEWFGNRIVWAGDCAENEENTETTLYDLVEEKGKKVMGSTKGLPNERYLLNLDKKEFIDLSKIKRDKEGFAIHPLPLLTCESNGLGGGDFYGEDERIGTWARDRIGITKVKPSTNLQAFNIKEDLEKAIARKNKKGEVEVVFKLSQFSCGFFEIDGNFQEERETLNLTTIK